MYQSKGHRQQTPANTHSACQCPVGLDSPDRSHSPCMRVQASRAKMTCKARGKADASKSMFTYNCNSPTRQLACMRCKVPLTSATALSISDLKKTNKSGEFCTQLVHKRRPPVRDLLAPGRCTALLCAAKRNARRLLEGHRSCNMARRASPFSSPLGAIHSISMPQNLRQRR